MEPNNASVEHLHVWQKAHALVLAVYQITKAFPRDELFGLTSQLRRGAVSVPANITEGYRKRGEADKLRFLNIAQASLDEAAYYLRLAHDLSYADSSTLRDQAEEVARLLGGYIRGISERTTRSPLPAPRSSE